MTDTRDYDPATAAARATAAVEHAEYIRWRAEQLVATDSLIGQQLQAKALELQGIQFEGEGRDESIRLVDHTTDSEGDKSWQDMLRPPGTSTDQAGGADTGETAEGVGGAPSSALDDMLVPGKATDPEQPANLDDALDEVAGEPVPAAAAAPRLDPAKVDKFKDLARKLMQQDGVPADQIEQRLDDIIAAAQQPLGPYTPPQDPPLPQPGFGEGFGDAWRSMEDTVHRLTGQDGLESFKDAWRDLGAGVVETVKDPYTAAVGGIGDEIQGAADNPAYWAGQRAFDATAGAATLPWGAEGAFARGALDDVARPGVPQEVIDTAGAGHTPAPVVDQPLGLPDMPGESLTPDLVAAQIGDEVAAIPPGGPSQTQTLADRITALNLSQPEAAQATDVASKTAFGATAGIIELPDGSKMVMPADYTMRIAMQVSVDGSVSVYRGDLSQFWKYLHR